MGTASREACHSESGITSGSPLDQNPHLVEATRYNHAGARCDNVSPMLNRRNFLKTGAASLPLAAAVEALRPNVALSVATIADVDAGGATPKLIPLPLRQEQHDGARSRRHEHRGMGGLLAFR